MNIKKIIVIGSCNTDMVIKSDRLPIPGETVIGGTFLMNAGGKGANQAVAAARQGGKVVFVSKTGNDVFGKQSIELYKSEGINTDYIFSDPKLPSGVALIMVDAHGENCIAVASGANGSLIPAADVISAKGVDNVVITMGAMGAFVKEKEQYHIVEATKVVAVDTTAAGDSFSGALSVGLSEGKSILDAVKSAAKVAALTVTRMGAQSSIPYRNELSLLESKLVIA
ncbi:MAG: bifunctional hydroxymethylpyrimidine kinase/phosphomethylpyrimidine kinase [Saprospiraceae bacterium]|nr:bifunctional hydroxymethylpyrimidine kinase/phosphomethylpyrimidine kinase [Candidatus Opimibacter iunctus]